MGLRGLPWAAKASWDTYLRWPRVLDGRGWRLGGTLVGLVDSLEQRTGRGRQGGAVPRGLVARARMPGMLI